MLVNLKRRRNVDIENLVAEAYRQGVLAGIRGARGETIEDQTLTRYPIASIRGSQAALKINRAFLMAVAANPMRCTDAFPRRVEASQAGE